MTTSPDKPHSKPERREPDPASRRRPELDMPDTMPVPSGVRPDLAESGEDGQGGDGGGVGNSI